MDGGYATKVINWSHSGPDAIEKEIRARVAVDPQLLVLAKIHLTEHCTGTMAAQCAAFVDYLGATHPDPVLIHPTVDVDATIATIARRLSATIALGEAAWALIGAGVIVPRSSGGTSPRLHVGWTTVVPGSGGNSSGWNFDDLGIPMPTEFMLAPSRATSPTHLSDGDLYLSTISARVCTRS